MLCRRDKYITSRACTGHSPRAKTGFALFIACAYYIISAIALLLLMSGCKKSGESVKNGNLETTSLIETLTNPTGDINEENSGSQTETEVVYGFEVRNLK